MASRNRLFGVNRRVMSAVLAAFTAFAILLPGSALAQTAVTSPLPGWNDTATKRAIVTFVERVTKQGSPDFVPPTERIATFDNDGTLWAEPPIYFQLAFALERVKVLAPLHPEWKDKEPFASLLKGDLKGALAGGEAAIFEIVTLTHSGMTTEEFEKIVRDWITTAKHPTTGKAAASISCVSLPIGCTAFHLSRSSGAVATSRSNFATAGPS